MAEHLGHEMAVAIEGAVAIRASETRATRGNL